MSSNEKAKAAMDQIKSDIQLRLGDLDEDDQIEVLNDLEEHVHDLMIGGSEGDPSDEDDDEDLDDDDDDDDFEDDDDHEDDDEFASRVRDE